MLPVTLRTDTIRQDIAASAVCNVMFNDSGWQQSTLSVARGGLGLSSAANVSLPAYASSLGATRHLVHQILQDVLESCPAYEVDAVAEHWTALGHEPIMTNKKPFQLHWPSGAYRLYYVPSNLTLRPVV